MTREEKIKEAAQKYVGFIGVEDKITLKDAFKIGTEWALGNQWHSVVDGDFPPKAKNNNRIEFSVEVLVRLDKNKLDFGRYDYTYKSWYVGLQRVYPTHWMEIPQPPRNVANE